MSSISESERIGLDDLFLSLGKEQGLSEKLGEHKNRLISGASQAITKVVPLALKYVKSKKIMFQQGAKVDKSKLFNQFRPKNGGSK